MFKIPSTEELLPKSKPIYSKPIEISSFSYNSQREFLPNRSELKQYKPELINGFFNSSFSDLNFGREKFISKPEDYQEHLDGLIKALSLLPKTEQFADFITWRGIMTRIISTPFKPNEPWSVNVMRRSNTIYIEDDKTRKTNERKYPKHKMYSYWGHRFEHMIMNSTSNTNSNLNFNFLQDQFNEPVNTWREFGVVLKSKLGGHRLIFGAEVDGLDETGNSYIELKTSKILKDPIQVNQFYQQKLISFWAQSFLAGIPKILVGFRNDRGIVKSVEYIVVNEIPRITRGKVTWCPETMLNFGILFLDWLSAQMKSFSEEKVFRMDCDGSTISLSPLNDYPAFVPDEFKDAFYY